MINFLLWSEIIIRVLSMGVLILVVVSSVYSIVVDTKRKKENDRLKGLIDDIEVMLQEVKKE